MFRCHNASTTMRVVMDGGGYLCVIIPTIKRRDLGGYKKVTTCKSCSYRDLKFLHPQWQLQQVYLHLDLHRERGLFLITTENTTRKHDFVCFHSKRGFSFSRPKVFNRHNTGAPILKGVLFFVFLAGSIGSIQLPVAENSHHTPLKLSLL